MNAKTPHGRKAHQLLFAFTSFLCSSVFSFGQTNVAVAPSKMNVLYIGIDNPVSVAASNGSDDKVTVSVSGGGGSVAKIGSGLYNVRVADLTNECLLKVYVDGKLAGTSSFRVRNLPVPVGTIGGQPTGAHVMAETFQEQAGLGIYVKDFPFEVRYEVVGFSVSVDDGNGGVKSADCEGAFFSSQARQYIDQYVKPGGAVTVDRIRVKEPGGRILKLPSLVYFIK